MAKTTQYKVIEDLLWRNQDTRNMVYRICSNFELKRYNSWLRGNTYNLTSTVYLPTDYDFANFKDDIMFLSRISKIIEVHSGEKRDLDSDLKYLTYLGIINREVTSEELNKLFADYDNTINKNEKSDYMEFIMNSLIKFKYSRNSQIFNSLYFKNNFRFIEGYRKILPYLNKSKTFQMDLLDNALLWTDSNKLKNISALSFSWLYDKANEEKRKKVKDSFDPSEMYQEYLKSGKVFDDVGFTSNLLATLKGLEPYLSAEDFKKFLLHIHANRCGQNGYYMDKFLDLLILTDKFKAGNFQLALRGH